MSNLRGGLIGCGYISKQQLWAWQRVAGAEIVAVCDLELERAQERAQEFNIAEVFTDYHSMLDKLDLDFVDIATRPESHLKLVSASATRGAHILCQKPLADTMKEAQQMVSACDKAGVTFMVNENGRHQAWFRKTKALLDQGALGNPHYARFQSRWRATLPNPDFEGQPYFAEMPMLIVYEMGVHYLDTSRYLFGEASSIYAQLKRVSPHIFGEDMAVLMASFDDLTLLIDTNWYSIPEPGEKQITWGTFTLEGTEGTLILHPDGKLVLYLSDEQQYWSFSEDTVLRSFVATQQHFIDCLKTGQTPETSGRETLKTMALVFAAYKSSEEGRVIAVEQV